MKRREKESSGVELSTLCRQLMKVVTERIEQYGNNKNRRIQRQRDKKNDS